MSLSLKLGLLLLPILLQAGNGVETGSYLFRHYTHNQYNASPQNWAIAQAPNGILYVANTEGVLEYDGVSWRKIPLPNGSPARSLAVSADGIVYVGGQGDCGFLAPDDAGALRFVSLLNKLPSGAPKFTDVWNTLSAAEGVYFGSAQALFLLSPKGLITRFWRPVQRFGRLWQIAGTIYGVDADGLKRVRGPNLEPVIGAAEFNFQQTLDILPSPDGLQLLTNAGVYRLTSDGLSRSSNPLSALVESGEVSRVRLADDGTRLVATRSAGLKLAGIDDSIQTLHGSNDEFVGKHITDAAVDSDGGIWAAGVDRLQYVGLETTRFGPEEGLTGNVYTIVRDHGILYLGTSVGLFELQSGASPNVVLVPKTKVPVYGLTSNDHGLFITTGVGLMELTHGSVTGILHDGAVWDVRVSHLDASVAYSAGVRTLDRLQWEGSTWKSIARVPSEGTPFRSVEEDKDGRTWAATQRDVVRIDWKKSPPSVERFNEANRIPAGYKNVYRLQNEIVFATEKGFLHFDPATNRFVPWLGYGPEFADGSRSVLTVAETSDGGVWITGKGYHGRLDLNPRVWHPMPLLRSGQKELYAILPEADGVVWAAGPDGFLIRYDSKLAPKPPPLRVHVRRVRSGSDTVLYGGAGTPPTPRLAYAQNNLRFEFAAPFFEDPESVEYQVRMDGVDSDWSPWSHETYRDYTHLFEGKYTFHVRARNPKGALSDSAVFALSILPPWYRTYWAYLTYTLFLGFMGWKLIHLRTAHLRLANLKLEGIVAERTAELETKRIEAVKATEAKSEYLAKVSHEIRTPLNAVIGMTDVLASGTLTPDQKKCVEVSQRNSLGLLNLVNDILDLAKVEAGKIEIEITDFDLREVIAGAIEVVEAKAAGRGLRMRQHIDSAVLVYRRGDPNRVRQVLINLLSNALKFTECGGIEVRVTPAAEGTLQFAVIDTGIGIPAEKIGDVFEKFSQVDASTTRKYGGTGLGLAISKQLVELMGGRIWVESALGEGTTFFFTLPVGLQDDQSERSAGKVQAASEAPADQVLGLRILLADDSEDNRFLVLSYLKGLGCQVDQAENGLQALELVRRNTYDVVLMDGEMPEMDGFTATREVRRMEAERRAAGEAVTRLPILAFTAHAFTDMTAKALAGGFDGLLTKPIRKAAFLEALVPYRKEAALPQRIQVVPEPDAADEAPAYLEKRRAEIPLYERALAEGDVKTLRWMAHKMKGNGAAYGFTFLSEIGAKIEQSALENRLVDLHEEVAQMIAYLNAVEIVPPSTN